MRMNNEFNKFKFMGDLDKDLQRYTVLLNDIESVEDRVVDFKLGKVQKTMKLVEMLPPRFESYQNSQRTKMPEELKTWRETVEEIRHWSHS